MLKLKKNSLLTELERQDRALAELPDDFDFPLFNTRRAVESQRRSAYRNTAAAAREIVDNAIEAGAKKIYVIFERSKQLKKYQRAESVRSVAFVDNGSGMRAKMARFALSWGGGTHFDDPDFIGKFGFGLPNASINQTRVTEVYTRTNKSERFSKAVLDIRPEVLKDQSKTHIAEPKPADLPEFVQEYLNRAGQRLDHGTVVVWKDPDNLTYRMAAPLKEHLIDDFGVTYRYLLDGVELVVEGVRVEPVDPLFTMVGARYYLPLDKGGARITHQQAIPVKYFIDEETGTRHLTKVENAKELTSGDPNLLAVGTIGVKIVRFPVGFAAQSSEKSNEENTDAIRRFEIRKSRRGMSFVRAGREIETVDVFPRSRRDRATGLGRWPLLQSYAYHWGIEVTFDPSLDEPLGIANDKQTVRPSEDFWRVLAHEEIDRLARAENSWQLEERSKAPIAETSNEPTHAERAAAAADSALGKKLRVPDESKPAARAALEEKAKERAKITKESLQDALAALEEEAARRKYRIDYVDIEDGPFYKPSWEGPMVVLQINRRHSFYSVLYGALLKLKGGDRAKQAVDVLLLALAKAENGAETEEMREWYATQRKDVWSPYLRRAMNDLIHTMGLGEINEEETQEDNGEGSEIQKPAQLRGALMGMGFRRTDVERALAAVATRVEELPLDQLLREALAHLRS